MGIEDDTERDTSLPYGILGRLQDYAEAYLFQ